MPPAIVQQVSHRAVGVHIPIGRRLQGGGSHAPCPIGTGADAHAVTQQATRHFHPRHAPDLARLVGVPRRAVGQAVCTTAQGIRQTQRHQIGESGPQEAQKLRRAVQMRVTRPRPCARLGGSSA